MKERSIIGIVIGVVVFLAALSAFIYFLRRKRISFSTTCDFDDDCDCGCHDKSDSDNPKDFKAEDFKV